MVNSSLRLSFLYTSLYFFKKMSTRNVPCPLCDSLFNDDTSMLQHQRRENCSRFAIRNMMNGDISRLSGNAQHVSEESASEEYTDNDVVMEELSGNIKLSE